MPSKEVLAFVVLFLLIFTFGLHIAFTEFLAVEVSIFTVFLGVVIAGAVFVVVLKLITRLIGW